MAEGQPYAKAYLRSLVTASGCAVTALLFAACGSTTVSELSGPELVRCAASLTADPPTVPADGAVVTVTVTAARDCTWSARSEVSWLQVRSASGQGDGTFTASASRNDLTTVRSGGVAVNDQRLGITQEGQGCTFTLTGPSEPVPAGGGRRVVSVGTLAGCAWSATSSVPWIVIVNGSGAGPANVAFDVQPNSGAAREASITVGSRVYVVSQAAAPTAPPCTFTIDRQTQDFPVAGGQATVTVTTQAGCAWTVEGGAPWTTIVAGSGAGSGEARYTVAPNLSSTARSTTLTIAGRAHTITQPGVPCTFSLTPASRSFAAAGGPGQVQVDTQAGCTWTAASNAGWMSVSTITGIGPGTVMYTVQPSTDTATRNGAIVVAGQQHAVSQSGVPPACTYTLDPMSRAFSAAAGSAVVRVNTLPACTWTASSDVPWVTPAQSAGTGSADITYSVAQNTSTTPRNGTLTIGGAPHAITQAGAAPPPCTYQIAPAERSFEPIGGSGTVRVTTGPTCAWTAVSSESWVSVTTGKGVGTFDIQYVVAQAGANVSRVATVTIEGQVHTVRQGPPPPPAP